jgi:hypothetical protein
LSLYVELAFTEIDVKRTNLALLAGCLILTAVVQRRAVSAFFSSPDDLIHLQQAVGMLPTLSTPLRFVSQVLYLRAMIAVFGPSPVPFHVVTLALDLLNTALVFILFKRAVPSGAAAALGATLFGCFPLTSRLLSSAVGVNDELALALALVALVAIGSDGGWSTAGAVIAFGLGLLCKESVIFLPILALFLRRQGETRRLIWLRTWPLLVIATAFVAMFLVLRSKGLAPGGAVYAMRLGSNVFHNLMMYTAWSVDVRHPMPDMVTSYDREAWRVGLWVAGLLLVAWRSCVGGRRSIGIGASWWMLGLLPVLPLRFQTYRHYLYPALPGLALAAAATTQCLLSRLVSLLRIREPAGEGGGPHTRHNLVLTAVLATVALVYAGRADQLIEARLQARLSGTELPLDPVLRRQETARRALLSFREFLPPGGTRVVILTPEGLGLVFGARTGKQYTKVPPNQHPYDLLEESLDHGRAVRLFYPQVDSVAFAHHWSTAYRDFELFLPYVDGYLLGVGRGPQSHASAAQWMLENAWYLPARDYLKETLVAWPDDPVLRFAYSGALLKTGDSAGAFGQLREIMRRAPDDSLAATARMILEAEGQPAQER